MNMTFILLRQFLKLSEYFISFWLPCARRRASAVNSGAWSMSADSTISISFSLRKSWSLSPSYGFEKKKKKRQVSSSEVEIFQWTNNFALKWQQQFKHFYYLTIISNRRWRDYSLDRLVGKEFFSLTHDCADWQLYQILWRHCNLVMFIYSASTLRISKPKEAISTVLWYF